MFNTNKIKRKGFHPLVITIQDFVAIKCMSNNSETSWAD